MVFRIPMGMRQLLLVEQRSTYTVATVNPMRVTPA